MKTKLLYLAFIIVYLVACKEDKKDTTQKPEPPPVIPTVTPAELHGTWVKAEYMEDISQTRSPLKSFKKLSGIAIFAFDTVQIKSTQLDGGISFNGHEGSLCRVTFQSGKTPRSIFLNFIEGDTTKAYRELVLANNELLLMSYPTNGSAIGERFVRASSQDVSIDNALDHALRRALFAGKWQRKETSVTKSYDIELTEDGIIKGDSTYKKYSIVADFMVDAPPSDQIYLFSEKTKKPRILQFKINNDTVKLMERVKKKDTPVYQWIRRK
jgi:hypothetical protein